MEDIKEFQNEVVRVFGEIGKVPTRKNHTKQSATIHLVEEIGEIARQVTNEYGRPEKFDKENLSEELADAMMFIVFLANLYDVDISNYMKKSVEKVEKGAKMLKEKLG